MSAASNTPDKKAPDETPADKAARVKAMWDEINKSLDKYQASLTEGMKRAHERAEKKRRDEE